MGVTPHRSVSYELYARLVRLVHEPSQAECCNHALIPLFNTPTIIILKKLWINLPQVRNLQKTDICKMPTPG
jgi:hypothetical protein